MMSSEPPEGLGLHAQIAWRRLHPIFSERDISLHELLLLAAELGTVAEQDENLIRDGLTIVRRRRVEPHPSIAIKASFMRDALDRMRRLGLDPDDPQFTDLFGSGGRKAN
jgi:phage terminase small subunit